MARCLFNACQDWQDMETRFSPCSKSEICALAFSKQGQLERLLDTALSTNMLDFLSCKENRGSGLGGNTGRYFLRFVNADGFILSQGVVGCLVEKAVIEKARAY